MPVLRILVLAAGISILAGIGISPAQDKDKKGGPPPVANKAADKKAEKPAEKPAPPLTPIEADEKTLRDVHLDVTGAALLELLQKRMPTAVTREQTAALMKQLADKNADVYKKAAGELVKLGTAAEPALLVASRDVEELVLADRAKQCLDAVRSTNLLAACARLLAERNPDGTVDSLFKFLPYADDETLANEIVQSLAAVCFRGGATHPGLLKALDDPMPVRRATAAELLCRQEGEAHRPLVRKLLQDPKPHVRMRAALALAEQRDVEAVPVLIDLLADMPAGSTKPIEDYLTQLAGEWALSVPAADDPTARKLRRELWAAWWRSLDGPALLEEFRKRTVADADREKAEAIIARLNKESPEEREKAEADMLAMGNNGVPSLRKALHGNAPRNTEAIRRCLDLLQRTADAPLPTAAARLLGMRRPPGAASVLLAYLPCAEEDSMTNEVRDALTRVAVQDGKIDPALIQALDDKHALRRYTAAEAICQSGNAEDRTKIKKLLDDRDIQVKLRVALALGAVREKEAVGSLIGMLDQLPLDQVAEAEDFLRQLAGDNAPKPAEGEEAEARRKHKEEWAGWWKTNGAKIDLAKTDSIRRLLGYTLIVEAWNPMGRGGRVVEVDASGKKRWELNNLRYPTDASVIGNDRLLMAEYHTSQVTERDFKGKILWTKNVPNPTGAQRLTTGNTLITTRNQLVEVDRNGKEVWTWSPTNGMEICQAHRYRNGQTAVIDQGGRFIRLDSKGKELRTTQVGVMWGYGAGAHFLPNDHVLMPLTNENKVAEYNASGKIVWEASVMQPSSAHRLPNGNVLVAMQQGQKVIEMNRAGKTVWEFKDNIQPHYATRR
jgi:HEAT repeat protein/outer membrane protein assembly factor BamB